MISFMLGFPFSQSARLRPIFDQASNSLPLTVINVIACGRGHRRYFSGVAQRNRCPRGREASAPFTSEKQALAGVDHGQSGGLPPPYKRDSQRQKALWSAP
jgi:hypothetical protein